MPSFAPVSKNFRSMLALVPLSILIAGFFVPEVGLAVPFILMVAVAGSFRRRRWFCSEACPRAALLEFATTKISRRRPIAAAFRSPSLRTLMVVFLILCSAGQTVRLWPDLAALGRFFWLVCAVTAIISLSMGYLWKPRAWCAVCPVGALQDTITAQVSSRSAERKE